MLAAAPAGAQTPADPAPAAGPFVIESAGGDNRLQLAALVQFDGRFLDEDPRHEAPDTLLIRRARPILQGRVARHFEFYLNLDFAGSAVNLRDAYFDTRFSNAIRVRVGKGKEPFGLERLHAGSGLLFVERALPTTVAPDRDMQVQLLGEVWGGRVDFAASIGNGVVDGGSADVDANDSKDLIGRAVVRPFPRAPAHPLGGLGLGLAASTGTQAAELPQFVTSGRQRFFAYAGAVGEGRRTRWSPQAFYYRGPFGGYFEHVRSSGDIRGNGANAPVGHTAWQVAGSWVLTGEPATSRGVARPRYVFDPPSRHWGALQLAARYHELAVDPAAIRLGLATPDSSRQARAFTLGANWYLTPYVKWVFNFERTVFAGRAEGPPREPENALLLRAQMAF